MARKKINSFFLNKRGQKEGPPTYAIIIGTLLALLLIYALISILRGLRNAALPK